MVNFCPLIPPLLTPHTPSLSPPISSYPLLSPPYPLLSPHTPSYPLLSPPIPHYRLQSTPIHSYPPLSTPIHSYPLLSTPIHPYSPNTLPIPSYPLLSIPLGFLMFRQPENVPKLVFLLAESFNPHVRYGACFAIGIACAGTALKDAIDLLTPMLEDQVVH